MWQRDGEDEEESPRRQKGVADDLTRTGAMLGAVGGALMALSILLPWISHNGTTSDVFQLIASDLVFFFLLIAEMLGVVSLAFSLILLRSASWEHMVKLKWAWSLMGVTLLMLLGLLVGVWQLQQDYLQFPLYKYEPAAFLAVFGIIFSVMGSFMYLLDTRKAVESKVAQAGFRPRRKSEFQEMATTPKVYHGERECPQCGETVTDDMVICPSCAAVLDGIEDENMERVR